MAVPRAAETARARHQVAPRAAWVVCLVVLHILLGRTMASSSLAPVAHALGALAFGMGAALIGRHPASVAMAGAYIAGAEVLWRMTKAPLIWEFGKYAIALVFLMSLLRRRRVSPPAAAMLYLLFLLPSTVLTLNAGDFAEVRRSLSFNLSGPLALGVSVWFFSRLTLSPGQLRAVIIAFILPVAAIAALLLGAIWGSSSITFALASNYATSGGFGPNQVSAILGLAGLLCAFGLLDPEARQGIRVLLFIGLILFAVQSALTFSRGGLYVAGVAFLVGAMRLLSIPRLRRRLLSGTAVLALLVWYLLLPQVDAFTGGALTRRFRDLDPTGRERLVAADLQIWREHTLLGVGPGQGADAREAYFRDAPAHTEFSRLLAEHGLFGAAAMVMLLVMTREALRRHRRLQTAGLATALIAWSYLYMTVNAMRIAAPALVLGLACATIVQARLSPSASPDVRSR